MKILPFLFTACALTVPAPAQNTTPVLPDRALQHFDRDRDGKLNETEQQALEEARKNLRGKIDRRLARLLENPGPILLEKFDADKDGKLSGDEQAKARGAMKARADKARSKFDANGDGTLDGTERSKARETLRGRMNGPLRGRILHRLDADGDGRLNEAERAKAKAAREARAAADSAKAAGSAP